MKCFLLLLFMSLVFFDSLGQGQLKKPLGNPLTKSQFTIEIDKPFKLLELNTESDNPIHVKKKRPKPRVFYGIKTKKGYIQRGYKNRKIVETFYYLKQPDQPNHFVQTIYWYDFTRKEIRNTKKFDSTKGALLHGPYHKKQDKILIEEGVFYKGTKHARWMKYSKHNILEEKKKYYKGWPKESLIIYFNAKTKTKTKEIIPIENEEREGHYFQFHENGIVAVLGEYRWNNRVGIWIENYPTGKPKKIIVYPKNPFQSSSTPFIKTEWNKKGKKIYSKK